MDNLQEQGFWIKSSRICKLEISRSLLVDELRVSSFQLVFAPKVLEFNVQKGV